MTTASMDAGRYERWTGTSDRSRWTWLAIVSTGMRLANKDSQVRLLVWFSLSFVVGTCAILYTFYTAESIAGTRQAQDVRQIASTLLRLDLSAVEQLGDFRPLIWRIVFLLSIQVQLFWLMPTVSRVGPGLIADDIRTRALPIYFARPLTPLSYVLGKWMVVAAFIGLVVLVPNVASVIVGVLTTGGLSTWSETMQLAGELIVVGLIVMVVAGVVSLALSSLSSDKRYVAVGWFAICILPTVAQQILRENLPAERLHGFLGSISLYGDLVHLAEWVFRLRSLVEATELPARAFSRALGPAVDVRCTAAVVGGVTLLSAIICYRRVLRFSRAAANL